MSTPYEARILRVLDHIYENPAGDLSLDALADVAAVSRFHWHRCFRAMTGETCAQAVRRIRLHRAAAMLVQTDRPIPEISAACGYPSPSSFSRAFRTVFGRPPGQFRKKGTLRLPSIPRKSGDRQMYDVDVTTHPTRRLAAIPHKGPYFEISQAYEKLAALAGARTLWPQVKGCLGVFYDDPDTTPAAELSSHAALEVGPETPLAPPLEEISLEGGKVAVLRLKGPYSGLAPAYAYLYGTWLPQSGEEPRDTPSHEIYLNSPDDSAPEDLLTDICIPLA